MAPATCLVAITTFNYFNYEDGIVITTDFNRESS